MAKEVRWTGEAITSFDRVIDYLQNNWTEKEVVNFIKATQRVISLISKSPKMFRKVHSPYVHEALVTPHNLLIYKIYSDRIDLITFWDTRQHPFKKKI